MTNKDTADKLKTITDKITGLPTLPTVITKITQLMQNPRISAEEVGKAISSDQSLTSKVLKLVNSAFYGFPGRINTITHAIVILGFNTVKNIVLTASIFEAFGKGRFYKDFDLEKFWLHSIAVGAVSKIIAKNLNYKGQEEVFIGGLMHDLGKVILCQYAVDLFLRIIEERKKSDCLFIDAEKEVIGINHQEVGGWLVERWNLPRDLYACIQNHHNPSLAREHSIMVCIVHFADILARTLGIGSGGDNRIPLIDERAWELIKPNEKLIEKYLSESEHEAEKAAVFLQIV